MLRYLVLSLFLISTTAVGLKAQTDQINYTRNWETSSGQKEKLALVIGNSLYEHGGQLSEPANDAKVIKEALLTQGFDVMEAYNLKRDSMWKQIRNFSRQLKRGYQEGLLYYAGHGFQVDGENFLIPIDAQPTSKNDVSFYCINLDEIFELINAPTKPKVVILDACRNNPFKRSWVSSERGEEPDGLASINPIINSLTIFSTIKGTKVADDNPFAEQMAVAIRRGGPLQGKILGEVAMGVAQAAPGQVIWQEGTLYRDVCFGPCNNNFSGGAEPPLPERPDVDKDGVADIDDGCPTRKGYAALDGCPLTRLAEWRNKMDSFGYTKREYDQEMQRLRQLNIPEAKSRLGYLYLAEKGTMKNLESGLDLISFAASAKDTFGEYLMGISFLNGIGSRPQMPETANFWLEKAATQGMAEAQYLLAKHLEVGYGTIKDPIAAFKWMALAAGQGYAEAENDLGNYYFNGTGTETNQELAIRYYQLAAKKQLVTAQINLGHYFLQGKGVAADIAKATYWYEKAAKNGDVSGLHNLGITYFNGEDVLKDERTAITLFQRAARAGYRKAQVVLQKNGLSW